MIGRDVKWLVRGIVHFIFGVAKTKIVKHALSKL